MPIHSQQIQPVSIFYNPNYYVIESYVVFSELTLLFWQETNQMLCHVHRQVTDHNPWYIL